MVEGGVGYADRLAEKVKQARKKGAGPGLEELAQEDLKGGRGGEGGSGRRGAERAGVAGGFARGAGRARSRGKGEGGFAVGQLAEAVGQLEVAGG